MQSVEPTPVLPQNPKTPKPQNPIGWNDIERE
jgi:hypothetical protein